MTRTTHSHHWLACSGFGQLMASPAGRLIRVVAGVGLIAGGLVLVGGVTGIALAVVGVVPLLAGLFDVCLATALLRGPLHGAAIRSCAR